MRSLLGGTSFALANAGTASAGAAREYARRKAAAETERSWGQLAPIAKRFAEPKQSTHAWHEGRASPGSNVIAERGSVLTDDPHERIGIRDRQQGSSSP